MEHVYFDYAATSPCDPAVLDAMRPYFFEQFGNASSPHAMGRRARKAIESSREETASFLGAQPADIVFTGGATEANNHAVFGMAHAQASRGKHLVISAIEHHSILKPAERLAEAGYSVTYVQPDARGLIPPAAIAAALRPDTVCVAVGHANNEIGVIQDIAAIGSITRGRGIPFLVDAVQTFGHIPVDVQAMGCDVLSLSAHKMYGPQGVGALYIRKGCPCSSFLLGGDQERGRRATTPNTAGIVGLGAAVRLCRALMVQESEAQTGMRERIIDSVIKTIPGVVLNGSRDHRLPNNAHFSFEGVDGEELIAALDLSGIACSMGSACTSGQLTPSHVLKAIGLSDRMALGSLRVTLGRWSTASQVEYFLAQLNTKVAQLTSA